MTPLKLNTGTTNKTSLTSCTPLNIHVKPYSIYLNTFRRLENVISHLASNILYSLGEEIYEARKIVKNQWENLCKFDFAKDEVFTAYSRYILSVEENKGLAKNIKLQYSYYQNTRVRKD